MTRGLRRLHHSGQNHFITFSCYPRQANFTDRAPRDLFLTALETMRARFGACIYGYVVMPEQVHLLLSEPERGRVAEAIHFLKLSFAKRVRAMVPLPPGPFGQKRYYDLNIRNDRQFVEKLRYIHRNPVKRGLCAGAAEWPWSSFRHYAFGEAGTVEIESEWTARQREETRDGRMETGRTLLIPG